MRNQIYEYLNFLDENTFVVNEMSGLEFKKRLLNLLIAINAIDNFNNEPLVVGLLIDDNALFEEWICAYFATLLSKHTLCIIPPMNSNKELLQYLYDNNVTAVIVDDRNNDYSKLLKYASNSNTYYESLLKNLVKVVIKLTDVEVVYNENNVKLSYQKWFYNWYQNESNEYITKEIYTRMLPELEKEYYIIQPTGLGVKDTHRSVVYDNKNLKYAVAAFVRPLDYNDVYDMDIYVPLWKYHIISVLVPMLNGIHISNYPFDNQAWNERGRVTMMDGKMVSNIVKDKLYELGKSRILRFIIPGFVIRYFGVKSLKKYLKKRTRGMYIVNNRQPYNGTTKYLVKAMDDVYSIFGSQETLQLTSVIKYGTDKEREVDPYYVGKLISSLVVSNTRKKVISGSTLAAGYIMPNNITQDLLPIIMGYNETDDNLYVDKYDNSLYFEGTELGRYENTGRVLFIDKIVDGFRSTIYISDVLPIIQNINGEIKVFVYIELDEELMEKYKINISHVNKYMKLITKSLNRMVSHDTGHRNLFFFLNGSFCNQNEIKAFYDKAGNMKRVIKVYDD